MQLVQLLADSRCDARAPEPHREGVEYVDERREVDPVGASRLHSNQDRFMKPLIKSRAQAAAARPRELAHRFLAVERPTLTLRDRSDHRVHRRRESVVFLPNANFAFGDARQCGAAQAHHDFLLREAIGERRARRASTTTGPNGLMKKGHIRP